MQADNSNEVVSDGPDIFSYDQLLETPFISTLENLEEIETKYSEDEIWDAIKTSNEILPVETLKLIHEFAKDGEWLIFDKTGDTKEYVDTLSVNGACMYVSGKQIPQAIFVNGVDTFWPIYSSDVGRGGWLTWNFTQTVSIYQFKVRAEEYSNYGHFAKEILLFAGMDPLHKTYKYGIKLHTKQCGGWQFFYNIDLEKDDENEPFVMSGKYWRIIINKTHDENRYGEIAQIDMKGLLANNCYIHF